MFIKFHIAERYQPYLWGAVGVVVLIGIGLAAHLVDPRAGINRNTEGMMFFEGKFADRALYEMVGTTTEPVSFPVSGRVVDYARGGGREVVEAIDDRGTTSAFLLGDEPRILIQATSSYPIGRISLSPDGTMIAFATNLLTATSTDPTIFYTFGAWGIETLAIDATSTIPRGVGSGYAPRFFVRDGKHYLFYTVNDGVAIVKLPDGLPHTTKLNTANSMFPAEVSPDGSYLAFFDKTERRYMIAPIESVNPTKIGNVSFLPANTYLVAFKGNTIFSMSAVSSSSPSTLSASLVARPFFTIRLKTVPETVTYRLIAP